MKEMRKTVNIVNRKQAMLYIKNGLKPKDIYISKNDDNKDIFVFIFDKEESYPLFMKWCEGTLN